VSSHWNDMLDISRLLWKSAPHGKALGTKSWCATVRAILLTTGICLLLLRVGGIVDKQKKENKE
jgi:hypothetical protein